MKINQEQLLRSRVSEEFKQGLVWSNTKNIFGNVLKYTNAVLRDKKGPVGENGNSY